MRALRVLVIDDVYVMRVLIRNILEEEGHEVVGEAKDGREGLELFRDLAPDLVTLDINMPILDGLETLKAIRDIDPDALVLTVSGSRDKDMEAQMLDAGSFSFVRKPFQPNFLLTRIRDMESDLKMIQEKKLLLQNQSAENIVADDSLLDNLQLNVSNEESEGPVLVTPSTFEDDLLIDSHREEFELQTEQTKRPDPVFVVKNDYDSIVVHDPNEEDEQVFDFQEDEDITSYNDKYALTSPEDDFRESPNVLETPALRPEMFNTHDESREIDIRPPAAPIRGSNDFQSASSRLTGEDKPTNTFSPPISPRGFDDPADRLRELRNKRIKSQSIDEHQIAIVNSEKDPEETKPSLLQTVLSLFKK